MVCWLCIPCVTFVLVLRFICSKINFITLAIASVATILFISYNVFYIVSSSSHFLAVGDFVDFVVTMAYPVLDLILIIPSVLILVNLRKDYVQSVPWFLSSLSLLINAIADDGYVGDFVNGHLHNLLFWDMFYVLDFIIMAGALFWYNRFHIPSKKRSIKINANHSPRNLIFDCKPKFTYCLFPFISLDYYHNLLNE